MKGLWRQKNKKDLEQNAKGFIRSFEENIRRQERARMIAKYNIKHGEDCDSEYPLWYHVQEVADSRSNLLNYILFNSHLFVPQHPIVSIRKKKGLNTV